MTLDHLIEQHGPELGEAMWWCAVQSGEIVFQAANQPDALQRWAAKSYLDWDWR